MVVDLKVLAKSSYCEDRFTWKGCEESTRNNVVRFGRWWISLHHERSCCSTWVPRKINMELGKDSRSIFCILEEGPVADKGIEINRHTYKYIYILYIIHMRTYVYIYSGNGTLTEGIARALSLLPWAWGPCEDPHAIHACTSHHALHACTLSTCGQMKLLKISKFKNLSRHHRHFQCL